MNVDGAQCTEQPDELCTAEGSLLLSQVGSVSPLTLARGLAHTPRYAAQFRSPRTRPQSVGQHTLALMSVCRIASPAAELAALLHDAAEAVLGDWTAPLKYVLASDAALGRLGELTAALDRGVAATYGRPDAGAWRVLELCDRAVVPHEMEHLFGRPLSSTAADGALAEALGVAAPAAQSALARATRAAVSHPPASVEWLLLRAFEQARRACQDAARG